MNRRFIFLASSCFIVAGSLPATTPTSSIYDVENSVRRGFPGSARVTRVGANIFALSVGAPKIFQARSSRSTLENAEVLEERGVPPRANRDQQGSEPSPVAHQPTCTPAEAFGLAAGAHSVSCTTCAGGGHMEQGSLEVLSVLPNDATESSLKRESAAGGVEGGRPAKRFRWQNMVEDTDTMPSCSAGLFTKLYQIYRAFTDRSS